MREEKSNCIKCEWLIKYGIDFLINYGNVNIENLAKFLDIAEKNIKYDYYYKNFRDKLKENDL